MVLPTRRVLHICYTVTGILVVLINDKNHIMDMDSSSSVSTAISCLSRNFQEITYDYQNHFLFILYHNYTAIVYQKILLSIAHLNIIMQQVKKYRLKRQ